MVAVARKSQLAGRTDHGSVHHSDAVVMRLAAELQVSVEEVSSLYEMEIAKLQQGARIAAFVPILAIKKVRDLLHMSRRRARRGYSEALKTHVVHPS